MFLLLLGWYNLGDDGTTAPGYFPHYSFTIEKIYAIHGNYAINHGNYGEQKARGIFLYTLAGVVARYAVEHGSGPVIYMTGTQAADLYLEYIASEGIPIDYTYDVNDPNSLWQLAAVLKPYTSGHYLKCNQSNASVNWATSLAAKYMAPVADGRIVPYVEAIGYTFLKSFDAAGGADYTDEGTVYNEYKSWVEGTFYIVGDTLDYLEGENYDSTTETPDPKFFNPRDFIVFAKGWASYDTDSRADYLKDAVDDSPVLGWQGLHHDGTEIGEYTHVDEATRRSILSVPTDYTPNLPVTTTVRPSLYEMRLKKRLMVRDIDYPDTANYKYVLLQLSDGDNVNLISINVPFDTRAWASNLRGTFPFSWSISSMVFDAVPQAMKYYAETQAFNDTFTLPISGGGYFYYNHYSSVVGPTLTQHYERVNEFMKKMGIASTIVMVSDMPVIDSPPSDYTPVVYNLDKGLGGFIYTYMSAYNNFNGQVWWGTTHNGKDLPFISCKERVWDGTESESDVINNVNSASHGDFILVVFHAGDFMSDSHEGGVLGTASRLIEGFNSDVKVCGTEEFLLLYRLAHKPDQVVGEFLAKIGNGLHNLKLRKPPTKAAKRYFDDAQSNATVAQDYYSSGNYREAFEYAKVADRNLAYARLSYATLEVDSDNRTVRLTNLAPANPSMYFYSITEIEPSHPDYEAIYWQASLDENFTQVVYDLYMDWKMGGKNPEFTFPVKDGQKWYVRAKVREVAELEGRDAPVWGEWSNVVVLDRSGTVQASGGGSGGGQTLLGSKGYESVYETPSVSINIYPNPAISNGDVKLRISSKNFACSRVKVVVKNIMGFPVLKYESKVSGASLIEVPLVGQGKKPLKRGVYIVQVILEDEFGAQVYSSARKLLVK